MSSSAHRSDSEADAEVRTVILETGRDRTRAPLVLLHGSHGSECDLLPLAGRVSPGATTLAVRGTVDLGEGYAFFRRHPDRRVDEADLRARVPSLTDLLRELGGGGGLAPRPIVVGYSNGAIMAAALLAAAPELVAGVILFRGLPPFAAPDAYQASARPVLIIDGAQDARRSPADGRRLAAVLRGAGAAVTHQVLPVGHALTLDDEDLARRWIESPPGR